jgi:predicted enzyme related to lactoylglutathione lyase
MANHLVHFSVHTDDPQRAMRFYEGVFGWRFEAWGPQDFWKIRTGEGGIHGALQRRHEPATGGGLMGFECTIGVEDVRAIAEAVEAHGGTITTPPFLIEGVGTVVMFRDTEGNSVGAIQFESAE